jgi:hypothetical protein
VASQAQNPPNISTNTPPTSYPITIVKNLEFLVQNIEDYTYLTSQKQEDDFIADYKQFAEMASITMISIDGVKVE